MIDSAADGDRILLKYPQPWRGFSCVENLRPCPADSLNEPSRQRGDSAEPLEQVCGHTLAGQQRPGLTTDGCCPIAFAELITITMPVLNNYTFIQKGKGLDHQLDSGQHERRLGHKMADRLLIGRYNREGRHITPTDIFLKKSLEGLSAADPNDG